MLKSIHSLSLHSSPADEAWLCRLHVVLAGGRMQPEEGADHQQWNVMSNPADRTLILVHVQFIQKILRRRPFMIKSL